MVIGGSCVAPRSAPSSSIPIRSTVAACCIVTLTRPPPPQDHSLTSRAVPVFTQRPSKRPVLGIPLRQLRNTDFIETAELVDDLNLPG